MAKMQSSASQKRTPKKGGNSRQRPVVARRIQAWQKIFLATLAGSLNVTKAAAKAKVARRTAYDAREADPEFARAWDEAVAVAVEAAEGELYRRAVDGIPKPVFYLGKKISTLREYSDTLLIFLLKSHKPERYRETVTTRNLNIDMASLTDEQLDRIAAGEDPAVVIAAPGGSGTGAPAPAAGEAPAAGQ